MIYTVFTDDNPTFPRGYVSLCEKQASSMSVYHALSRAGLLPVNYAAADLAASAEDISRRVILVSYRKSYVPDNQVKKRWKTWGRSVRLTEPAKPKQKTASSFKPPRIYEWAPTSTNIGSEFIITGTTTSYRHH